MKITKSQLKQIIQEEIQNVLDECWDSHKQVGMKPKGGRMVPNCVRKEELSKEELEEKKKRKKRKKRKLTSKPSSETSLRDWFVEKVRKERKADGLIAIHVARIRKLEKKHAAHAEDLVKRKEQSIPHVGRLQQHAVNVGSTEKNQKLVKKDKQ